MKDFFSISSFVIGNDTSYCFIQDSTQPHAVDSVGGLSYTYDSNGNMTYRGSDNQTITWDVENRPVTVSENGTQIASFIYDGDGNRIKKTEAGETVLYINRFYEKNLTTGNITTSYYLGSRLIAQREGTELRYIHQDHLSGTSLTTSDNGTMISSIKYFPFGDCRNSQGDPGTDRLFTGQRLDGTGLYYYGARYYDPLIGKFISADTIIPNPSDPQAFNRYSYCLNNPLKYIDPTGHWGIASLFGAIAGGIVGAVTYALTTPSENRCAAGWASSIIGGIVGGALTGGVSVVSRLVVAASGRLAAAVVSGTFTVGATAAGFTGREVTEYALCEFGLGTYTPPTPGEALVPVVSGVFGAFSPLVSSGGPIVEQVYGGVASLMTDVGVSTADDTLPIQKNDSTSSQKATITENTNNPNQDQHNNNQNNSSTFEDLSGSYLYVAYIAGLITYEELQNILFGNK